MKILVTGGAGFIGSHFVDYVLAAHPAWKVTTVDHLTYAGSLRNLAEAKTSRRHRFVKADITDERRMAPLMKQADLVVNFAAETHVDRSIGDPSPFLKSNIQGVFVLLELAKRYKIQRFLQIGTDEVYGPIVRGTVGEDARLNPTNPYSASKASADLLALSYHRTYGLPVVITRSSNNYGPRQFPEKVIPVAIACAAQHQPIPVYGDGLYQRDWIHVVDNCRGVDLVLRKGKLGEIYNVAGGHWLTNLQMIKDILYAMGRPASLIKHVKDRPGHDRRYAVSTDKLRRLGFCPNISWKQGIRETVMWYIQSRQKLKAYFREEFQHRG